MANLYKISDEHLELREYGRNVQMMVAYCKTLENRDERNVLAREIVRIMSNMNPGLRDSPDFDQKLWDHFYHLAEYEIDIDSEFEMPSPEALFSRPPSRMPYQNKPARFRQYGRNVELMAKEALEMEDPDRAHALVTLILNIMKMALKGLEKDSNAELIVCDHLRVITKGKIDMQPEDIEFYKFNAHPPMQQPSNNYQPSHGGGKGHKKSGKYSNNKKKKRK